MLYRSRVQTAVDVDRLQRELETIFGARRVSLRAVDLDTYSRDMWPRMLIAYRDGNVHLCLPGQDDSLLVAC